MHGRSLLAALAFVAAHASACLSPSACSLTFTSGAVAKGALRASLLSAWVAPLRFCDYAVNS
jgi:hypothetical protein